jgi:hypothetical protein
MSEPKKAKTEESNNDEKPPIGFQNPLVIWFDNFGEQVFFVLFGSTSQHCQ